MGRNNPDFSSDDESEAVDVVTDTSPNSKKSPGGGRKRKITHSQPETQPTRTVSTVRQLCRQTQLSTESTQQQPVVPPSKSTQKPKAVKKSQKPASKKCKKKKCTCSASVQGPVDTEPVQGSSSTPAASKLSVDKKPKGRPKKKKTLQETVTEQPPPAGSQVQPSPPKIPKRSPAKPEVNKSLLKK